MKRIILLVLSFSFLSSTIFSQHINEIHYDNIGGDTGEFVEVFIPDGDENSYTIVLYNGNGGGTYGSTHAVSTCPTGNGVSCTGTGTGCFVSISISGIQNGDANPDGMALIRDGSTVIEFISYEGSFAATNGPANGMTSTDIGASESGTTSVGSSLQMDDSGSWAEAAETPGACNTSQLPVELLSFTATQKEKSILLNWATATEINNDHFLVEYSRDGLGFKSIAQIEGMGNSLDEVKYEFMHEKPNTGTNYYRLKQMDFDGTFEYSNIVSVTIENDKDISIQPNLVKDNIKLVVKKGYTKELSIEIFNILGAKVMEAKLPAGALEQNLDVQDLQKGHYFLRVNTNEKPRALRFVKL